jgi:outer membrane protein insertion porin family
MKRIVFVLLLLGTLVPQAYAFSPFKIKDIRVEGLQRISAGTIFNYLPLKIGETVDRQRSAQAIRSLFKTGFFKDIKLRRDGNVLIVIVQERPSIASISFSGNKDIDTDDLKTSLKRIGLAVGQVYRPALLERVEAEMRRQYFSNGKYAVKIKTTVTPQVRNRVAIKVVVSEGKAAKIRAINIIGNKIYKDEDLLDLFKLSTPTMFSFYTGTDQYSKQKLAADLAALRTWYLDRGYLTFKIKSTQVSISPDKKYIYLTINIHEGVQYKVGKVRIAGKLVVKGEELERLVTLRPGMVFAQKRLSATIKKIGDRLGDEGYAFANINAIPRIDKKKRIVNITLAVDPGRRVYVRRINFYGNNNTSDVVLRREMRQMEGGWFSTKLVKRSKIRLQKLGYFTKVTVTTPQVAGTTDQVDVNFKVVEKPSGNFLASVGYSQTNGVIFSTSVKQDNFLGTGKQVGFTFNNSDVNKGFSISYVNPYHTIDGISRGFVLSSQETDASEANLSNYVADNTEFSVIYGIPLTEYRRLRLSLGFVRTDIKTTSISPTEVSDYINTNGNSFDTIRLGVRWTHDSRNKAIFANRGVYHSISAEVTIPGSDLEYYKISYRHKRFYPISKKLTLSLKGEIAYGDGYGKTGGLPFFNNFFAGGVKSVRGYEGNSLGPRDSNNNPLGGALKLFGSAELIFPVPFAKQSETFRMSAFMDVGNVYKDFDAFDAGQLRASVGLSAIWISPIGPLQVSLATPINDKDTDDTQIFQFTLGGSFF